MTECPYCHRPVRETAYGPGHTEVRRGGDKHRIPTPRSGSDLPRTPRGDGPGQSGAPVPEGTSPARTNPPHVLAGPSR